MTPKEKAKEMFDKYYENVDSHYSKLADQGLAKSYSLMAIDFIWSELKQDDNCYYYWKEVYAILTCDY